MASKNYPSSNHTLKLNGKLILWDHFVAAYEFNNKTDLRLYRHLSRDHIYPSQSDKMCNHIATNVLSEPMLNLFRNYQKQLADPTELDSVISLLEQTSALIDIFSSVTSVIETMQDARIVKLLSILDFFHKWEQEYKDPHSKYLITKETQEDIDACIYGFIHIAEIGTKLNIPIPPGYINLDLIENWFCQIRGLRNGFNQNPTLQQIGPAINSNIITGSLISKKRE